MTGALANIDIVGRGGEVLRDNWQHGPRTYLGLGVDGFPKHFIGVGTGRARSAGQHVLHAEAHVKWIADCIGLSRRTRSRRDRTHRRSGERWIAGMRRARRGHAVPHGQLLVHGANVPGKPRVFMLFLGGFAVYNDIWRSVAPPGTPLRPDRGALMSGLLERRSSSPERPGAMGRAHCERFADTAADLIALYVPAMADELGDTATEVEKRGRRCVTGPPTSQTWMR